MKKTYKCDKCSREFKTEEGCEVHEEHCNEEDKEEWTCDFCGKNFSSQHKAGQHEKHCNERESNKKKSGGGGGWIVLIIIILLILLGIAIFFIAQSGAVEKAVDPCKRQLDECNYSCGEGIFNKICKEVCSSEYQDCELAKN